MTYSIYDFSHNVVGEIDLSHLIQEPLRLDILHRVVCWQLAKRRAGTHQTKGISQVSGTTRKPYKQKGTGRARQGSLRSPQFRGGAVIFGPQQRSHETELNKEVRKKGMKIALSEKARKGQLIVLSQQSIDEWDVPKTKTLLEAMKSFNVAKSALFVTDYLAVEGFRKSLSNIPLYNTLPQVGLNVYDMLRHETLFVSDKALEKLQERL